MSEVFIMTSGDNWRNRFCNLWYSFGVSVSLKYTNINCYDNITFKTCNQVEVLTIYIRLKG